MAVGTHAPNTACRQKVTAGILPALKMINQVISGGFCVGCGMCAAFDSRISIKFDDFGQYVAISDDNLALEDPKNALACPFSNQALNETELANELFQKEVEFDSFLGFFRANYAGWVLESSFRADGSSGGLVSWLLIELLNRRLIDYVVHVRPSLDVGQDVPMFRFAISSTIEEVRSGSKSRYYPVNLSEVVKHMCQRSGRYVVVGIPCFIKALRLASRVSPILKERLVFAVGIVCGHLKSTAFAEALGWQCGLLPSELRMIDFRTKLENQAANRYGITVSGFKNGQTYSVTKPVQELFGSNWGHGFLKYKACDFCDDVIGETADISVGDAWLPEYENDPRGANIAVVRSEIIHSIILDSISSGRLHLDTISKEKIIESQAAGFRHRREGLAYRLFLEDKAGRWRPTKRVKPSSNHLSFSLKKIHSMRQQLREASHQAFAEAKKCQDFELFLKKMQPLVVRYENLSRRSLAARILSRFKRVLISCFFKDP